MRVLLVEDDAKIASAVARGLEQEGFTLERAADGEVGLSMAEEGEYDLIVLDLMLPGRRGEEVCRALRDAGDWTPLLVITALPAEQAEVGLLDLGADAFVAKPFAFETLLANARALLRRGPRRAGDELSVGTLRVNPRRRRAWHGDREIDLTSRQFDVLEFLIRRADQVVTKDEILRGVWSFDFDGASNIVEVYIRRLRERIDEPFGTHTIETVRGVGYRIVGGGR